MKTKEGYRPQTTDHRRFGRAFLLSVILCSCGAPEEAALVIIMKNETGGHMLDFDLDTGSGHITYEIFSDGLGGNVPLSVNNLQEGAFKVEDPDGITVDVTASDDQWPGATLDPSS